MNPEYTYSTLTLEEAIVLMVRDGAKIGNERWANTEYLYYSDGRFLDEDGLDQDLRDLREDGYVMFKQQDTYNMTQRFVQLKSEPDICFIEEGTDAFFIKYFPDTEYNSTVIKEWTYPQ
jgi:hypothetical protein